MFDFAVPPEITSGRIYAGPGEGSLLEAAASWSSVAVELESFATGYQAIVAGLGAVWQGPSASAMISAASLYAAWARSTSTWATSVAQSATNAVAAFQTVFASVVPPEVIATNRMILAELVAANILGQNTPAIMTMESAYMDMWAQDIEAMTAYQASSQMATSTLSPAMTAPAVTTAAPAAANPLGLLQGTGPVGSLFQSIFGVTPGAFLENTFESVIGGGFPFDLLSMLMTGSVASGVGSIANTLSSNANALGGSGGRAIATAPISEPVVAPVTAAVGNGNRVGNLCTPPSWGVPPAPKPVSPLPRYGEPRPHEEEEWGLPVIPAVPVAGGKGRPKKGTDPDSMDYGKPSPPVLFRHPSGG